MGNEGIFGACKRVVVSCLVASSVVVLSVIYVEASESSLSSGFTPSNATLLRRFEQVYASPEALRERMAGFRLYMEGQAALQLEVYADATEEEQHGNYDDAYSRSDEADGYSEAWEEDYSGRYQYISSDVLGIDDIERILEEVGMTLDVAQASAVSDVVEVEEDELDVVEGFVIEDVEGFALRLLPRTETTFDINRIISGTAPNGTAVFIEVFGYDQYSGEFFIVDEGVPVRVGASQGFARMIYLELGRNFVLVTAIYGDTSSQQVAVINRLSVEVRKELEGLLLPGSRF